MRFQEIQEEHLMEISKLYCDVFNSEPWDEAWDVENAYIRLSQLLRCESAYGLAAYEGDKIVGAALGAQEYFYTGMQFNIKEFYVSTDYQNMGIGTKILNTLFKRLKGKGIKQVYLTTLREESIIKFYHKNRFKTSEKVVLMYKNL